MVVDDEPDQIFTAKTIIEDFNSEYEVIGAKSGEQCLELLKNNQIPDVIFLDIMMPGMNGWDVAAEIKKNPKWKKIPLVFLTAKTDSFSTTFGKIVSQEYIKKPFEIKDFKKSIERLLKDKNARNK